MLTEQGQRRVGSTPHGRLLYSQELEQLSAEQGGRSARSILRDLVHREWLRTHPVVVETKEAGNG